MCLALTTRESSSGCLALYQAAEPLLGRTAQAAVHTRLLPTNFHVGMKNSAHMLHLLG
jgi:hypothetical protein